MLESCPPLHVPKQPQQMECLAQPSVFAQVIRDLIAVGPTVIRGNASEIMAAAGGSGGTRGVDSSSTVEDAVGSGKQLAQQAGCIVAISGSTDMVCSGMQLLFENLVPLLTGAVKCMGSSWPTGRSRMFGGPECGWCGGTILHAL